MIKKNNIKLLGIILTVFFISCPLPNNVPSISPSNSVPSYISDKSFWGSWVRMDGTNEEWYISDSFIKKSYNQLSLTGSSTDELTISGYKLSKETDNMILVNPNTGSDFYIFRKSGATAQVKGGVIGSDTVRSLTRGLGGLGDIDLIISNINNSSDTTSITTDIDGNMVLDDIILGDDYIIKILQQLNIDESISLTVKPEFEGQDLGFITINDANQNFKVSYSFGGGSYGYHYAERSYSLTLRITNIGTEDMLSADYEVTVPDSTTMTGDSLQNILGTVQANGGVKELDFVIRADAFTDEQKSFDIPISITGIDGNQWEDTVGLRFFRESLKINIKSESNEVQGVVISPDNHAFPFKTSSKSGSITLPARNDPYILALSGASYNSETKYSLMVDDIPSDNGSAVTSALFNEPNNNENEAIPILLNTEAMGYLGVYDLDFYQIYNAATTTFPIVSGPTITNDDTPTWSWNDSDSAIGYRYSFTDGSNWISTGSTSFTPSTILSDGNYTLHVQAQDVIGNWSDSGSWSIEIDTFTPEKPVFSGVDSTSNTKPTWTWTGSVDSVEYRYSFTDSANWTLTTDFEFTPTSALTEGIHVLYIQGRDLAGNWSSSNSFSINIDTTPPDAPIVTGSALSNNSKPTWNWNIPTEAVLYRYSFTDGTNWIETTNNSFTPSIDLIEGTYTLYVQASDDLGTWSSSNSFQTDVDLSSHISPIVISDDLTNNNTPTWSWDDSSSVSQYRYSFSNGTDWNITTDTFYTPSVALSDGVYTLYVQKCNSLGYWSISGSYQVEIDTTPPVQPTVNGYSDVDKTMPTWSWSESDDAINYRYNFDNGTIWTNSAIASFTPTNHLADGEYSLYVQACDQAGNWSISGTATTTVQLVGLEYGGGFIISRDDIGGGIISSYNPFGTYFLQKAAFDACSDYQENGYDDWFMPSISILTEVYTLQDSIAGFSLNDMIYWSSTFGSNDPLMTSAYFFYSADGSSSTGGSYMPSAYILPVRSFSNYQNP